jgi:hypothetical protein
MVTEKCLRMRTVLKVHGLTLLLQVRTLWRHDDDDDLFFEVPPTASGALLTMLHLHLENVLQTGCCKLQEEPQSFLFMTGKAQKSYGVKP